MELYILTFAVLGVVVAYFITTEGETRRLRRRADFYQQLADHRRDTIMRLLDERDAAVTHAEDAQAVIDDLLGGPALDLLAGDTVMRQSNVRVMRVIP